MSSEVTQELVYREIEAISSFLRGSELSFAELLTMGNFTLLLDRTGSFSIHNETVNPGSQTPVVEALALSAIATSSDVSIILEYLEEFKLISQSDIDTNLATLHQLLQTVLRDLATIE